MSSLLKEKLEVKPVIAIALPYHKSKWSTMSFPSTLYLCPVLDLLLSNIPIQWHAEVRLGLQEALVNAAKHGNNLDPSKTIVVRFRITEEEFSWIISDEGSGFIRDDRSKNLLADEELPPEDAECGRGLCILYQIFDRVHWNQEGNELRLSKQVKRGKRQQPLFC